MRISIRNIALLLLCLGLCLLSGCSGGGTSGNGGAGSNLTSPGSTSNNSGTNTNGYVSGVVVDTDGVAVSGVTITAYHTNNNIGVTTTTNASGAYSFTRLYTGAWTDYQVYAEKSGFAFYPSPSGNTGGIIKADYNGLYRTVIHFSTIPTTPLTGANFIAYRAGEQIVSIPRTGQTISYVNGDDASANKGVVWPTTRFTDNKDGTVTDGLTGLVWMKNAGCFAPINWSAALTFANQLASGSCGLTDGSTAGQWRMPNVNELESLVDISRSNPALSAGNPFTNVANSYWSSSSYQASLGTSAMVIRFTDGPLCANNSETPATL